MKYCEIVDEHRSAEPLPRTSWRSTGGGATSQPMRTPGDRIFENVPVYSTKSLSSE